MCTRKGEKAADHTGGELSEKELADVRGGAVVSRGVLNGSAISLPKPAYPSIA